MKSLIENYVSTLTVEKLKEFALKNNIHLNQEELEFILNMIKESWNDILNDETKYLEKLKDKLDKDNFNKIKELVLHYKKKYKSYLF